MKNRLQNACKAGQSFTGKPKDQPSSPGKEQELVVQVVSLSIER